MTFNFNGHYYFQTGGTAMGTAVAPNYVKLFMDRFETKALQNWLWFIDDIFDKLLEVITYFNGIHPTPKPMPRRVSPAEY